MDNTLTLVIATPDSCERSAVGPTAATVLIPADSSGGLSLMLLEFATEFSVPAHRHDRIDHIWHVLAGALEVSIGERVAVLSTGASAFIPAGTTHSLRVTRAPAKLLELDTKGGLEAYYRELARAFPVDGAVDPRIVAAIQQRHDTQPSPMPAKQR